MEQALVQSIPWQGILNSPSSAWAVVFIILLIFVMYQNGKREERLTGIIEGSLKEQTQTLNNINNSLQKISDRVDTIEDIIDVSKGGMPS